MGDRLAGFAVLLPADPPGPVVLAVTDVLAPHLLAAFPAATVLPPGWSAGASAPPAGSAGLVLVDTRRHDVETLRPLLAPEGVLAALGEDGEYVVHPSAESPEMLWRRGWPVNVPSGPVPWLRRRVALAAGRPVTAPRLELSGASLPSLADEVVADVGQLTGDPGRLVGVTTAGHAVLRVRGDAGDVAVRLSLTDPDRAGDRAARVLEDVPELAPYLPRVLALGRTRGRPWVATEWKPRRRAALSWPWPSPDQQWRAADDVASVLAGRITGSTGPGWADAWCAAAEVVPAADRRRWADELRALEGDLPTTWCHGDLWPGNVLVDGDTSVVIDWDNASPDAPQGMDGLLMPALRAAGDPSRLASEEILSLVDDVGPVADTLVAGRRWSDWERPMRRSLALAAVVLYLRNRSLHDLGEETLARHLSAVTRALEASPPPPAPPAADQAGRTARGALWLATNGIVVKGAQTIVLLTLAALLAPSALGLVALGTLVANFSLQVTSLGTASALVYWRGDVLRAARTAVTIGAGLGAVLAAALWVAAPWLASALRAEDGGAAVIRGLTVTLPFLAVASVTNELLRRRLEFLRRIIPDTVSSVVGATVAIAMVMQGSGVMALVVGQVVQAVLTLVLAWVVHPPVLPGWDREDARGLLSYGGPYAGANLLELVQLNVDYLIVARVLGAVALGQYSLGFRLAFMPYLMIVVVITGAAFPYLCRMRGRDLGRSATVVMTATLTLVAPLCVGLAVFADHLVLLGDKWADGVPVVGWLALYAALLSVGQLVQTSLNAAGRPAVSMCLRLTHLLLLLAIVWAVVHHGIAAVAVGQVLAASVVALVALVLARVFVPGFSLRGLAWSLRPAATGVLVMTAVVLAVRRLFPVAEPSLTHLLVVGTIGVLAFALPVWLLDRDNLRDAGRLLRRPT
ncbi:oligosaccharide flippase family protein [Nocardioides sp. cx-169]|uniref:oligosaccharide flippase family protein n=1 Tax=Nocardioides sp. cx-169 TaxID=2899080 RepID=UPI001E60C0F4|nr:oligosaccharide flippase family protein [Nocardioides sp. cx-169]MCD4534495.1 oligosaccharide flippase family protein [Nocardioides sp. cx-169]